MSMQPPQQPPDNPSRGGPTREEALRRAEPAGYPFDLLDRSTTRSEPHCPPIDPGPQRIDRLLREAADSIERATHAVSRSFDLRVCAPEGDKIVVARACREVSLGRGVFSVSVSGCVQTSDSMCDIGVTAAVETGLEMTSDGLGGRAGFGGWSFSLGEATADAGLLKIETGKLAELRVQIPGVATSGATTSFSPSSESVGASLPAMKAEWQFTSRNIERVEGLPKGRFLHH